MTSELTRALDRFARTYMNTGCDWDEAQDVAKDTLTRLRQDMPRLPDHDLAWQLDAEAWRYEDM